MRSILFLIIFGFGGPFSIPFNAYEYLTVHVSVQQVEPSSSAVEEFFKAVSAGDVAKVKESLQQSPVLGHAVDKNGITALMRAIYYRKAEIIPLIVATGVLPDVFAASAMGDIGRLHTILTANPKAANDYSPDGFSPLQLAAHFGQKRAVEILLTGGARVDAVSSNALKATPLQSAAVTNQVEIAKLLLEHGADVNARGEGGYTPLHEAAGNGYVEFARLLLDHKADLNARGADGKTPLSIAMESKQTAVVSLLRKRGASN